MSLKFWNKQISFINQAKSSVYKASDYEGLYNYEELSSILKKLNNLLLMAEDKNLKNDYNNEDFLEEKKIVVASMAEFISLAEKATKVQGNDFEDYSKVWELAINFIQQP